MENLRWILLAIGALIVVGIYLWDYYNKKRIPRRRSEVIFNQDVDSDMPMTPYDDEPRDYLDAISGLNKILHTDEPVEPASELSDESSNSDTNKHMVIPRSVSKKKYDLSNDFFGEPLIDDGEQESEQSSEVEQDELVQDELIILRIVTSHEEGFKGLKLLTATKNVDMKFGNMNIFHHYGVGEIKSDKPIFSLANMYEPGEFNLQEMDNFTTKGIVIYMSFPTPIDSLSSFELMLNTCQRLADDLDGELKGARGETLDDVYIEQMRDKARQFAH